MILDDISDFLDGMGQVSLSWPLWKGYMAPSPDQGIGIFETGGFPPDTLMEENVDLTFQLRIRSGEFEYAAGHAKWEACFNLLRNARQTAGSPVLLPGFYLINQLHDGPLVWTDGNRRPQFTSNFRVKKTRS